MNADAGKNLDTVPCLTICQPWAWAILNGPRDGEAWKKFENRGWASDYVGPLVIHAGKSDGWMAQGMAFLGEQGCRPMLSELVFGAVLGVVQMVDCVRPGAARRADGSPDPFAVGPFCHVYENPRRLATPVPYLGQQKMFRVPRAIVAELLGDEKGSGGRGQGSEQTKEQKLDAAIAAAGGPTKLHRIEQRDLW